MGRHVVAALCVLWLTAGSAEAGHGKVDKVTKSNGDVVICEVISLLRGILTAKTDGMGTVSVEWNKVVGITSPAGFEVELTSGAVLFGTLGAPAPGRLSVNGSALEFNLWQVVRITPIDRSFWRQLDGSVDLGYSFTQADQRSQWSFNATVERTTRKWVSRIAANSVLTFEDTGTRQSRNTVSVALQRQLANRWFVAAIGQADQNEQLGLDARFLGGGGFGRTVIQSNRVLFSPFLGLTYTQERYTDEPTNNLSEVLLGARLDWFTFGDYKTDLMLSEQTYFDTNDFSKVRVEINTTFKQEIVKDLYLSMNLLESFNAAPPNNNKKNDLTLSMSLGWSF
ncbi:MAG TPA: DUF481 domain-containing protein [Vicinamibacterales bacterium]|nr:DUF481 domain-containing protein [Vicinamibacterales bacterium]